MSEAFILLRKEEFTAILSESITPIIRDEVRSALQRANRKAYLTNQEFCDLTGWSRRQAAYKRQKGELPYIKRGRTILYRTTDVHAWLDEGVVPSQSRRSELAESNS